ncbi:MAG: ComEC/Rec2 family competence protein [Campylobacterales bacterium]|nr:ComEC/Rec2 family competence protein [Campylobacterales bacterium]
MQPLHIFASATQRFIFLLVLVLIFSFQIYLFYLEYQKFIKNEVLSVEATVENIYTKKDFNILKLHHDDFTFFTSVSNDLEINKLDQLHLYILTSKITFYEYLKGFYTKSFGLTLLPKQTTLKNNLVKFLTQIHHNDQILQLYQALYLAIPPDDRLRNVFANYGISHLIALSGFHLGLLFTICYFLLYLIYTKIHDAYFPYRNKKYDITVISIAILFSYMIFVNTPASLLRSFLMFVIGIYFLRNNIKILSYETLFIVVCIIVSLFPKLLFSLSLWFSAIGVFYIFLFLQYFSYLGKYQQFALFNFWIFLAVNPIVHYFFDTTSVAQFLSPILSVLFVLFYPLSLILHIFGIGNILDSLLTSLFQIDFSTTQFQTPSLFTLAYIVISLGAIRYKIWFYTLNIMMVLFCGIYFI